MRTPNLGYKARGKFFLGPLDWDLDCAGNEGDSMLLTAEQQLSQPGHVRHPLLRVLDSSQPGFGVSQQVSMVAKERLHGMALKRATGTSTRVSGLSSVPI